ncbi:MAG: hypothetical protein RQ715_01230 [Methylococcales bacterium]|nr:hypothetical protein [Methylococcales bacterium]
MNFEAFQNNLTGATVDDIEQCEFARLDNDQVPAAELLSAQTLDAGFLDITASSGTKVALTRQQAGEFIGYDASLDAGFFRNASFTFEGNGGPGVGPFRVTVPGVPEVQLNQPANNFTVDRNQGLNLSWQNNAGGAGEVFVSMSATNLDFTNPLNSETAIINCRFVDDGNASVPADLLRQLAEFAQSGGFGLPDFGIPIPGFGGGSVTLTLTRNRFAFFNTSQAPQLDTGVATVTSSQVLSGTIQ